MTTQKFDQTIIKKFPILKHEMARELLAIKLLNDFGPIVDKAIKQAKDGDSEARKWITDRAWGKAKESIEITPVFSLKALSEQAHNLEAEGKMPPPMPLKQLIG